SARLEDERDHSRALARERRTDRAEGRRSERRRDALDGKRFRRRGVRGGLPSGKTGGGKGAGDSCLAISRSQRQGRRGEIGKRDPWRLPAICHHRERPRGGDKTKR